jgi:hypothetical protein
VKLRQENERLAENQLVQGMVLVSERRQASAAMQKAQADSLQARLGHLLAWAKLEQAVNVPVGAATQGKSHSANAGRLYGLAAKCPSELALANR